MESKEKQENQHQSITCDLVCTTDKVTPKWIMVLKSFTRVFVTYSWHPFTMVVIFMYLMGKLKNADEAVVMKVLTIEMILILFWFGERLLRNTGVTDLLTKFNKKDTNNK